jgi:hypothetical protein
MSFDLGVWHSEQPLTDAEASETYLRLCEEWPCLEAEHPTVHEFYQELIQHWPEIDTIPEEKIGDFEFCPWSCELAHSGSAVLLSCVYSKATDVSKYVTALARKYGLVLFDPQANRVTLPEHLILPKRGLLARLLRRLN